jgi:hypothetical protein
VSLTTGPEVVGVSNRDVQVVVSDLVPPRRAFGHAGRVWDLSRTEALGGEMLHLTTPCKFHDGSACERIGRSWMLNRYESERPAKT